MKDKVREKKNKRDWNKLERTRHPERLRLRRLRYELSHQERSLVRRARKRAKDRGTQFSITEHDIVIPKICPIIGIPIFKGKGKICANSPSLDEIIPGKGYIPGNIQVISMKANSMKSNATVGELKLFARWVSDIYGN